MSGVLLRRNPGSMPPLRDEWNDMLNWVRALEGGARGRRLWFPLDVVEAEDDFRIMAELAGVPRENVELSMDRNVLTISINKPVPAEEAGASYHIREREHGEFSRSVSLPDTVDVDKISATYTDGVLEVRVAKAAAGRPRKIDIGG